MFLSCDVKTTSFPTCVKVHHCTDMYCDELMILVHNGLKLFVFAGK